jgi:hypothetical protein
MNPYSIFNEDEEVITYAKNMGLSVKTSEFKDQYIFSNCDQNIFLGIIKENNSTKIWYHLDEESYVYSFLTNFLKNKEFHDISVFLNNKNVYNLKIILKDIMRLMNNNIDIDIDIVEDNNFFNEPNNFYFLYSEICWNSILDKNARTIKNLSNGEKLQILRDNKDKLITQLKDKKVKSQIYIFFNHFLNDKNISSNLNLNNYLDKIGEVKKHINVLNRGDKDKHSWSVKISLIEKEYKASSSRDFLYFFFKIDFLIKQINNKYQQTVIEYSFFDSKKPLRHEVLLNYCLFLEYFNNNEDFKLSGDFSDILVDNFVRKLLYLY